MFEKFTVDNIILDPNGEVFIKFPLGNVNYLSKDKWKFSNDLPVIFDTLERNLGHDLIIAKAGNSIGHVNLTPQNNESMESLYNRYLDFQKPFVIGKNDFVYRTVDDKGFIFGRYHVTNPRAKEYYRNIKNENKEIPYHGSIMIIMKPNEDPENIKDFKVIHNAIVDNPQFGFDSKMRAICVGASGDCQTKLLAAGNAINPCEETIKAYNHFFTGLTNYMDTNKSNTFNISLAGNKVMSEQEENKKPEPEGENKEGDTQAGKEQKIGAPIDLTKQVKDEVEKALSNIKVEEKKNEEKKPEIKPENTTISRDEVQKMLDALSAKYEGTIKELNTKIENQNVTVENYKLEQRGQKIGTILLQYQDFFRNKEGKIDSELFDKTLKYWIAKTGKEDEIEQDLVNTLGIAKNYLTSISAETEPTFSGSVVRKEQEQQPDNRTYREKMMDKIEDEKIKLAQTNPQVVKAGNVLNENNGIEDQYQSIIQKHRNGTIDDNNVTVY